MGKGIEEKRAAGQAGHEAHHTQMRDFHAGEAVKYAAKASELEARGKAGAAARSRKVAERNERLAAEHEAKRLAGYDGYQTPVAEQLAAIEAETGEPASGKDKRRVFRETRGQ